VALQGDSPSQVTRPTLRCSPAAAFISPEELEKQWYDHKPGRTRLANPATQTAAASEAAARALEEALGGPSRPPDDASPAHRLQRPALERGSSDETEDDAGADSDRSGGDHGAAPRSAPLNAQKISTVSCSFARVGFAIQYPMYVLDRFSPLHLPVDETKVLKARLAVSRMPVMLLEAARAMARG
jgi:hypothetical protein